MVEIILLKIEDSFGVIEVGVFEFIDLIVDKILKVEDKEKIKESMVVLIQVVEEVNGKVFSKLFVEEQFVYLFKVDEEVKKVGG